MNKEVESLLEGIVPTQECIPATAKKLFTIV